MKSTAAVDRPSFRQIFGELLITIGVVLALFAFYESFWTNLKSGQLQNEAQEQLAQSWEGERVNPRSAYTAELGEAFAQMYIPRYGSDWHFAILQGATEETLLAGPGHYLETQMPGEKGNFALAGHRVGKGAPFNDLGALNSCDAIVVETATEWITYRVLPLASEPETRRQEAAACLSPEQSERVATGDYQYVAGRHITVPGDVGVLDPIPHQPDADRENAEALLTLTTCHPQFSNAERMIIHAMAVETLPKVAGRPAALEES